MKRLNIHSISATAAGIVIVGYWAFYLAVAIAPRLA